jgi:dienelactone hydrolase
MTGILRTACRWILTPASLGAAVLIDDSVPAIAQEIVREELRIPLPAAGPRGLEALLVRAGDAGSHPLVLINHGSPRDAAQRPGMTPLALLPQAIEFVRRGWTAAIVMRRGYGDSGGGWAENFGPCGDPDYVRAGRTSASDLDSAIGVLTKLPGIDATRMLSVGVSAGGLATVALTGFRPAGLVAGINFAGGRGSLTPDSVCREDKLIEAFREFGAQSRIPMLWVYSQNDHSFGPALADKFRAAFTAGGGNVTFIRAPSFRNDGHDLFSPLGIPLWTTDVDQFLARQHLVMRSDLLPAPAPKVAAPEGLSANGRQAFADYLASAPHKAFAMAPGLNFGWRSGRRTVDDAKAGALAFCKQQDCRIMVNE